ncbi:MAG: hypothetical protein GWO44_15525 [Thermoplasmata archaeon]|nr:hypothetical protein [Thermoplasmata archaeon]NIY04616.1 hypothetical protein [Thermoplasmata archaeon]
MIRVSVHPAMNRRQQYLTEVGRLRTGFLVRSLLRRAVLTAVILFPVLVVLFLTLSGGSVAVGT